MKCNEIKENESKERKREEKKETKKGTEGKKINRERRAKKDLQVTELLQEA
jgi:hypothetical protein